MAGAGAGLDDLAVGEHAHGGGAAEEPQRWPGYIGLKSGSYCQGHPGGADQCLNDKGKRKQASRGYDDMKKFFCKTCAYEACCGYLPMRDVVNRTCATVGCKKFRSYGADPNRPATHCAEHGKPLGMIDICKKRCAVDRCQTIPCYGADADKPATHCAYHGKTLGMKNVLSKECVVDGCSKQPTYGADPHKPATHCSTHGKARGMTDVSNKKCVVKGCSKQPTYGADSDKPATHCSTHGKELGMKDVRHNTCEVAGCPTGPCYGAASDKPATHCATHGKKLGMVNVVSKTCAVESCPTRPCYGADPDKPATHCASHGKDLDMKNVVSKKCVVAGCPTQPCYGTDPDEPATHCAEHGIPLGMTNVRSKQCAVDGCPTRPCYPWAPYCAGCYAELHPDDPLVVARYKTETKIKMFLNDSLDAGISSLSTFNAMNVCGSRAPAWVRPYEFDFVILGERGIIHCDGIQHKRDVARFETTAADQIENDVNKSMLVLDRGLFEVRIDQDDTWKDRCDWRKLLTGTLAFGVTTVIAGEATCVVGRRDEADLSYGPYVDAMLQTPHADRVYEAFLTPNERDMLTVIHRASGVRTHWSIPSDFTLARWPDGDAAPAAPAVPTQLTLEGAFKRRKVA